MTNFLPKFVRRLLMDLSWLLKIFLEEVSFVQNNVKSSIFLVHLAYFSADKTEKDYFRHEASSLYSIQVLLERSIISNKFNSAQFGLIARRIIKMQQLFGIYTSTCVFSLNIDFHRRGCRFEPCQEQIIFKHFKAL